MQMKDLTFCPDIISLTKQVPEKHTMEGHWKHQGINGKTL